MLNRELNREPNRVLNREPNHPALRPGSSEFLHLAAREHVHRRERMWADRCGLHVDADGRFADVRDALCFEPGPETLERLARHPDRPLGEPDKRGPVSEPGSAWGLACNLLEAISDPDLAGLIAALGTSGSGTRRSWMHPAADRAGLPGEAPVLTIERDIAAPLYIEVRGAELTRAVASDAGCLPRPGEGWGDLEACRRVALDSCRTSLPHLPGATLRRLRSLSRAHGRRGFRYVVVWPRFDGHLDQVLRRGLDGLRMRIGGEIDFDALDLATLLARMTATGAHPAAGWLADRYLDAN